MYFFTFLRITKFTRTWMENHSKFFFFFIQILLIFGGRCNRFFLEIRLKNYWLRNFNMFFQLTFLLTKFSESELFSCLQKVDHVTKGRSSAKLGTIFKTQKQII